MVQNNGKTQSYVHMIDCQNAYRHGRRLRAKGIAFSEAKREFSRCYGDTGDDARIRYPFFFNGYQHGHEYV